MTAPLTVITGGARGIGLATAAANLNADPDAQCLLIDIGEGNSGPLVEESGGRLRLLRCDVADAGQVGAAIAEVEREGDVEITGLVNCAGQVLARRDSLDLEAEELRALQRVHLEGTLICSQTVARAWIAAGRGGAIVNVSSVASSFAWPGRLAYGVVKAGVESLTATLAIEWGEHGIRVNAVAPGYVDSPLMAAANRPAGIISLEEAGAKHALGRVASTAEIAAAIAFLLSDAASFVTGEVVRVDGGFSKLKN